MSSIFVLAVTCYFQDGSCLWINLGKGSLIAFDNMLEKLSDDSASKTVGSDLPEATPISSPISDESLTDVDVRNAALEYTTQSPFPGNPYFTNGKVWVPTWEMPFLCFNFPPNDI